MAKGLSTAAYAIIAVVVIAAIAGAAWYVMRSKGGSSAPSTTTTRTSITSSTGKTTSTSTPAGTPASSISASIVAGGSTFVMPQMNSWIQDFEKVYPNIQVTYNGVGSGAGINNFRQGAYDIGATDVPIPSNLYANISQAKGGIIEIPDIVGAEGIIYNIPGFNQSEYGPLNLTADVLAKIYLGQIQYWDDPAIQQLNPHFKFPHQPIIVVHRSDASGTTYVFTLWLYKSSSAWRSSGVGYGFTVNWPVDQTGRGLGGKGNPGVTELVKSNAYSIGYVEFQYAIANNITMASVQNPSTGQFLQPTTQTVLSAVSSVNLNSLPSPTSDISNMTGLLLNVNASGAYPIVTFSYLVIQKNYSDFNKAAAIYIFLHWVYTQGMNQSVILTGYLPLPTNVRQYVLNALNQITYNGQPVYTLLGGVQ